MSTLTDTDKRYFERLFGMSSGYVLDFTDVTFAEFFRRHELDIHGPNYQSFRTSNAKKLRASWTAGPDSVVGTVLSEMLDSYEADCQLNGTNVERPVLERARASVSRGVRPPVVPNSAKQQAARELTFPSIHKLPIEPHFVPAVSARLGEVQRVYAADPHLSVILLCGSALEAILLGAARNAPRTFNQAKATPKVANGVPKRFPEWTLSQLIDVACEVGILKIDVKEFSHGLRDFRNYIHPYEQVASGFQPDEHTAKVCCQVLKAALASLAGER